MTQDKGTIRMQSKSHGTYECRTRNLDVIIDHYGHNTRRELEAILAEEHGVESYTVDSRAEAFMILAELRGFATN